jgi:hypothetical protein
MLVTSRPVSGFIIFGSLTTTDLASRGRNGFAFATADVVTFSGFDGVVARAAAESASW